MSITDFERRDGLDGLTSAQLEARAFGPERRSLRLRRPPRVHPAPPAWRRRLLVGGALLALLAGAGSALTLVYGSTPGHHDLVYDDGLHERTEHSHHEADEEVWDVVFDEVDDLVGD